MRNVRQEHDNLVGCFRDFLAFLVEYVAESHPLIVPWIGVVQKAVQPLPNAFQGVENEHHDPHSGQFGIPSPPHDYTIGCCNIKYNFNMHTPRLRDIFERRANGVGSQTAKPNCEFVRPPVKYLQRRIGAKKRAQSTRFGCESVLPLAKTNRHQGMGPQRQL